MQKIKIDLVDSVDTFFDVSWLNEVEVCAGTDDEGKTVGIDLNLITSEICDDLEKIPPQKAKIMLTIPQAQKMVIELNKILLPFASRMLTERHLITPTEKGFKIEPILNASEMLRNYMNRNVEVDCPYCGKMMTETPPCTNFSKKPKE